uniref:Ig-like domain-containing protein n=1 Tax=Pygocentrus nattereri TaxID=42514 RepID=A0AAR2JXT4_PYGNA
MLLIFIASAVTFSAAEFSVFVPNGSVSERKGSSAVLPCGLTPALNAKMFDLRWYKNDYNNPVLLYKDLKVQENPGDAQYRGRVSLIGELDKGNVSLRLENLTLADGGEYVCFVKSDIWYEKASVNLIVRVLGSFPLFSLAEFGDQVNVSCASTGWSPKPTLTWRDKRGRELATSHIYYKTDSKGLVSVSSWLLLSPSESEWISCSVGLSDQEMKEGRVLPRKEIWREAFIATLVLSLFIVIILTALLLLVRKGLFPPRPSHKNTKEEETLPLTGPSEERLMMWRKLRKNKVKLTVDPETCKKPLTMKQDGASVYRGQLSKSDLFQSSSFPPALSKEGFSSGQTYWEVTVDQKENSKKSWCVGVTQKPPTEETLTALCYEEHCGIYPSTDPHTQIPAEGHVTTLGLILDFKHKTLSFINVDKESHLQTFRMNNMENSKYFALISPGMKDSYPVKFS